MACMGQRPRRIGRAKPTSVSWTLILEPIRLPAQLQFDNWIPFPLPQVFGFFSNPENLPRIMPAATGTRLDELHLVPPPVSPDSFAFSRAAGIGTVIVTSFRLFPFLPMRVQWAARITEFEWNHHFADVQQRGPFRQWHHRHEFLAETRNGVSGTLVRDVLEYEVGFGALGLLANALFVEHQVRATFAQRQRALLGLLS
jgi:ligand-binding SRPBCC domain-containing protein